MSHHSPGALPPNLESEEQLTTIRAAAGVAGVSVATVRWWISQGWLPAKPWSRAQVSAVAAQRAPARPRGVEHGTAECWRAGCTNPECRTAHRTEVELRRDTVRENVFPADARQRFLALVENGGEVSAAAEQVGVTHFVVWGRARKHEQFLAELDAALLAGRDPALPHGTAAAYRDARCKCSDCRAARRQHNS